VLNPKLPRRPRRRRHPTFGPVCPCLCPGRRRYKGKKAGTKACLHRRWSGTSWLSPAKPLSRRKSAKTGVTTFQRLPDRSGRSKAAPGPLAQLRRHLVAQRPVDAAALPVKSTFGGRRPAPARPEDWRAAMARGWPCAPTLGGVSPCRRGGAAGSRWAARKVARHGSHQ